MVLNTGYELVLDQPITHHSYYCDAQEGGGTDSDDDEHVSHYRWVMHAVHAARRRSAIASMRGCAAPAPPLGVAWAWRCCIA